MENGSCPHRVRATGLETTTIKLKTQLIARTKRRGQSTPIPEANSGFTETEFGPKFERSKPHPPGIHRRTGKSSVSGGLLVGDPIQRLGTSIKQLRSKISKLYDISDDVEFVYEELLAPAEEFDHDV